MLEENKLVFQEESRLVSQEEKLPVKLGSKPVVTHTHGGKATREWRGRRRVSWLRLVESGDLT